MCVCVCVLKQADFSDINMNKTHTGDPACPHSCLVEYLPLAPLEMIHCSSVCECVSVNVCQTEGWVMVICAFFNVWNLFFIHFCTS